MVDINAINASLRAAPQGMFRSRRAQPIIETHHIAEVCPDVPRRCPQRKGHIAAKNVRRAIHRRRETPPLCGAKGSPGALDAGLHRQSQRPAQGAVDVRRKGHARGG